MISLIEFLQMSKQLLLRPTTLQGTGLNIILGNESADLDSCVGSVLLAYHLFLQQPHKNFLPLINQSYLGFRSHFDVIHVLGPLTQELSFRDSLSPEQRDTVLQHYGSISITLYDHNIPDSYWGWAKQYIEGIVDHHQDKTMGYYQQHVEKNIMHVGSAVTIVGSLMDQQTDIDRLVCSTIMVDTFNFDMAQKGSRWVDKDLEVFQKFSSHIIGGFQRETEYEILCNLKYSVQMNLDLDIYDIFLKDYKEFNYSIGNCGYSIVYVSIDDLINKMGICNLETQIQSFKQDQNLQTFVIMFIHPRIGHLEREILIISKTEILQKIEVEFLVTLKLEYVHLSIDFKYLKYLFFKDIKAQYSRKNIEPILNKLL